MLHPHMLASRFRAEEDGVVSVWQIMTAITIFMIGGFAIDHSRVMSEQIRLQVASDTAAHAAAWALTELDEKQDIATQLAAARADAMRLAADNLGQGRDEAILAPDVQFGTWNAATRTFAEATSGVNAVRVTSRRTSDRNNALPTTYLGLVDLPSFNVAAETVFTLQMPACARDGIAACGTVQLSSGNKFDSGYCLHGNKGVSLNNGNQFDPGTIVSLPNMGLLDVPSVESNPGLDDALRRATYCPPITQNISEYIENLKNCDVDLVRDWCVAGVVKINSRDDLSPADLTPNAYHYVTCKNKQLFLDGGTYRNAIIHTPCSVQFRAGAVLEDVVIVSESVDKAAFSSPRGGGGIQIGRDDNCAPGGNAMLITPGGMQFAAGIQLSGAQLVAGKNVEFSAQGSGVHGGQISTGGDVISTSNIHFGPCPRGGKVEGSLLPVMVR